MKQFTMIQYPSNLKLQYAKANYYQELAERLASELIDLGVVFKDDNDRLLWNHDENYVGDDE